MIHNQPTQLIKLSYSGRPLKLFGHRVLVSLDLVSFMHLLNPLALSLATLRNPPKMVYTKKVFIYLKKALLERSFKNNFLKNQQKAKLLIRGFQHIRMKKQKQQKCSEKLKFEPFPLKFNHKYVKDWFQKINQTTDGMIPGKVLAEDCQFVNSIPLILEKRRRSDFRCCLRIKRILRQLIQKQKKGQYKKCQQIYRGKLRQVRIPWTRNIFDNVEKYGRKLWRRFGMNQQVSTPDINLKTYKNIKTKLIKKKAQPKTPLANKQEQASKQEKTNKQEQQEQQYMKFLNNFNQNCQEDIFNYDKSESN